MATPLTDADLQRINDNLLQLKDADEQAKVATAGGIDVSELKAQIAEQRAKLNKLKAAFFPGQ